MLIPLCVPPTPDPYQAVPLDEIIARRRSALVKSNVLSATVPSSKRKRSAKEAAIEEESDESGSEEDDESEDDDDEEEEDSEDEGEGELVLLSNTFPSDPALCSSASTSPTCLVTCFSHARRTCHICASIN